MFRHDPNARALLARILPLPPGTHLDLLIAQRPVFYDLPPLLVPEEPVLAYAITKLEDSSHPRGKGDWLLVCTDRRLLFVSRTLRGLEHFSIGRGELVGVDEDPGFLFYGTKLRTPHAVVSLFQYGKPDMARVLAVLRAR